MPENAEESRTELLCELVTDVVDGVDKVEVSVRDHSLRLRLHVKTLIPIRQLAQLAHNLGANIEDVWVKPWSEPGGCILSVVIDDCTWPWETQTVVEDLMGAILLEDFEEKE